jgi:murein DD-endopeptidase MepM/ murein hydrolase activator NlpD
MKSKTFVRIVAIILAIILAGSVLFSAIGYLTADAVTQSDIDELKQQQSELSDKKNEIQSQINSLEYEQMTALAKKEVLDEQMQLTQDEIENITQQIATYDDLIAQKEIEVVQAQEKEEEQLALYKKRVRAMEENGIISYLAVIFEADSFADLLGRIDFVGSVMKETEQIYWDLDNARLATIQAQQDLEDAQQAQKEDKAALETKQAELDTQITEAGELLTELEENIDTQKAYYEEVDAAEAELDEQIKNKIAEYEEEQRKIEEAKQNASTGSNTTGSGTTTTGSAVGTGSIIWPTYSSNYVTSYFGTRFHPVLQYYRSHNGIDIGASAGTDVIAADGGTVITATYSSSYGNYVMINHGNGMTTLYAHMSKLYVSVGDTVSQGQTIGLCGATGIVTGPHVHFEVWLNGTRVDPLNYFSSSSYTVSPSA